MSDSGRSHTVRLDDGRILAVDDHGPIDGAAVIAHHGTPSCRLDLPGGRDSAVRSGARVITFDRPGYGRSSELPGRRVSDAAGNAAAIADALGIDRFATIGVSGGGPHALATAALLGERVTRVCVSVGLGPIEAPDFDAAAFLPAETVAEIHEAQAGHEALRAFVARHSDPESGLDVWLEQLPASDREVLARPAVQACEQAVAREWQLVSHEGWIQDTLAFFTRPWGFSPSEVIQPTLLLYGGADVLVPIAHGLALSRLIVGSKLWSVPGGGHWLHDEEVEALSWLIGQQSLPPQVTACGSPPAAKGRTHDREQVT